MLEGVFKSVLIMSATGAVCTLFMLMLKPVSRRVFGEKIQLLLWLSVILVLIFPIKLDNNIRLPHPISEGVQRITVKKVESVSVFEDISGVYASVPPNDGAENKMITVGTYLWFWIGLCLFLKKVVSNLLLGRLLHKNSKHIKTLENLEIRESDNVGAPLLAGFLKPVLFVPSGGFGDNEMEYIVSHEKIHVKRRDIPIKWFVTFVNCVHWFNPFVYAVSRQLNESCELVCDIEAVKALSFDEKKEYMKVILDASQNEIRYRNLLTVGMSGGGKIMKRRFEAITNVQKNAKVRHISGGMIILVILASSLLVSGIVRGNAVDWQESFQLILPNPHEQKNTDIVQKPESVEKKNTDNSEKQTVVEPVRSEQPRSSVPEKTEELKTDNVRVVENEKTIIEFEDKVPTVAEEEKPPKPTISGEFNSDGGDTRMVYGVTPDEDGKITIGISSNAQETVDVYIYDAETGKEVHSMGIPVSYEAAYEMEGLEAGNNYNVVLKGTMRNDWNIESEYTIQGG